MCRRWGAVSSTIRGRAEEGLSAMNLKILFVSSALALGVAGCMTPMASAPAPVAVTSAAEFVPTATSSNLFEIESSRLALQRSRDPEVRRFAQQMIRDHNAASRRMTSVVRRAGLPTPPPAMNAKHQQMLATVQAAPNFDAAYVNAQLMAHQEAVALFTSYSQNGDVPQLAQFAGATLPVLEMHLEHVQSLSGGAARAM
jgi:putative membrane protein